MAICTDLERLSRMCWSTGSMLCTSTLVITYTQYKGYNIDNHLHTVQGVQELNIDNHLHTVQGVQELNIDNHLHTVQGAQELNIDNHLQGAQH